MEKISIRLFGKPLKLLSIKFLSQTMTLTSGTVLAQAITFLLSFLLTQLYLPEQYGHYSVFVGLTAAIAGASTGALESVLLITNSDRDARRIGSVIFILCCSTAITFVILSIFCIALLHLFHGSVSALPLEPIELLVFAPLFIVFWGLGQIFIYFNLRHERMRLLASMKIAQTACMGAVQVLVSTWRDVSGLIIGHLAGLFLLAMGGAHGHFSKESLRRDFRVRNVKSVLTRHSGFPKYVMRSQLIDNFSNQLPLLLIGTLLSLAAAGHYSLALMMLSAPAAVLGQAVGQVFLQNIGRDQENGRALARSMYGVWSVLALVGIVPFGVIAVLGPEIFEFAFGTDWREAGVIAQLLTPLMFVRFISSPTSSIYLKLKMTREQFWFVMAAVCYRAASYSMGLFSDRIEIMIIAHVILEITGIFAYNILALRKLNALEAGSAL